MAQGQDLDVGYLASLSPDAVPALVSLYQSPALDASIRDRIGAALACIQAYANPGALADGSWQSFHLSNYWADAALASMRLDLKAYTLDDSGWPRKVKTPQGKEYECTSYAGDYSKRSGWIQPDLRYY